MEPVLAYQINLRRVRGASDALKLRQLEEEEPLLHIVWKEGVGEIHAQVMGEVQIEVLKSLIWERFGIRVEFDAGSICIKRLSKEVEDGTFEPLRHYAEVHLLLEPTEAGSGLEFLADCSEDILDRNWQVADPDASRGKRA